LPIDPKRVASAGIEVFTGCKDLEFIPSLDSIYLESTKHTCAPEHLGLECLTIYAHFPIAVALNRAAFNGRVLIALFYPGAGSREAPLVPGVSHELELRKKQVGPVERLIVRSKLVNGPRVKLTGSREAIANLIFSKGGCCPFVRLAGNESPIAKFSEVHLCADKETSLTFLELSRICFP
jgi:hypothetical protein